MMLALALMISISVHPAATAPQTDKTVDVHGGAFNDASELACEICHEDAAHVSFEGASFEEASVADVHHFFYGEEIPDSTNVPYGAADESYACLSCHDVETSSGKTIILVENDCRVCHQPTSVETIVVDIRPGNARNPINPKSKGVLPVAILGSKDFDVTEIDVSSLLLEGTVAPLRWNLRKGTDGYRDLALKFSNQAVCNALGDMQGGQTYDVKIIGMLKDGTKVAGIDSVYVVPPPRKNRSKR